MMNFETFKMLLDQQRKVDSFLDQMYKMGVDLIDCEVFNTTTPLTKEIFKLSYGEKEWEYVYDWFTWYLYELPSMKAHPDKLKSSKSGKEGYAWDENGEPIDVDSDEGFFE